MARQNYSKKRMLILFMVGAMLRFVYFMYQQIPQLPDSDNFDCNTCQTDQVCPSQRSTYDLQPPANVPKTMYKPKGMYEVIRWTQFNDEYISDIINNEPKIMMNGYWNEEIQAVSQVALQYINAKTNQTWSLVRLQNGYMKNDVLQGVQYIVDLDLSRNHQSQSDVCIEKRRFRVELVHFLMPIPSSRSTVILHKEKVNLKVFLFATLGSLKIKKLVETFPTGASESVEMFIIVVTANKDKDFKKIIALQDLVTESVKGKSNMKAIVVVKESTFPRLVNLNSVLGKARSPMDIILLLSEDVTVKESLINHCKTILKPTQRVYFPVAFGQFNRELVVKGMPPGKSKDVNMEDHNKFTGQWLPYNYEFVCAYNQDFRPAISHLSTVHGGSEHNFGVLLNEQFMKQGVEVVRAVSPGLYKDSSNARCEHDAQFHEQNKNFCLHEKVMGMASKPALGILYLTDIENKKIKDDRR